MRAGAISGLLFESLPPANLTTPSAMEHATRRLSPSNAPSHPRIISAGVSVHDLSVEDPLSEAQDASMAQLAWGLALVVVGCFALVMIMRLSASLTQRVFAPSAREGAAGASGFPGVLGYFSEARANIRAVAEDFEVGLEHAMVLRYIWQNLRLLGYLCVLSAALIPIYAQSSTVVKNTPRCTHALSAVGASLASNATIPHDCLGHSSGLDDVAAGSCDAGSWELVVSGVAGLLFALAYVADLTLEWRWYYHAKQAHLEKQQTDVKTKAALLHIEWGSEPPPGAAMGGSALAETVRYELGQLLGDEEV